MIRTQVLGIGSYVPERVVTNDEIRFLDHNHKVCEEQQTETNDAWIQERTGIRERRYVPDDGSMGNSDLAYQASVAALADAGIEAADIDCIILATLSPDIMFPGTGVFLQTKLGINKASCPSFDIRQQCSGFVYGLQMADAFIRAGTYKRILLVGSEVHSHSLDFSTRGRNVMVLFGDGAGAVVLGPQETDDERDGVIYTRCHSDGDGAMFLYLKLFDITRAPYLDYDTGDPEQNNDIYPQMDGRRVYLHAVRNMVMATNEALATTGLTWDDVDWFVPHQANLRINQKVAEVAKIPEHKVLNTIEFYGNTTAATIPLTIDYWYKQGKVKKGDTILATVFGSGFTWGSSVFRL